MSDRPENHIYVVSIAQEDWEELQARLATAERERDEALQIKCDALKALEREEATAELAIRERDEAREKLVVAVEALDFVDNAAMGDVSVKAQWALARIRGDK